MRAEHLRKTHALTRPETALLAAEALRGDFGKAAVEGLIELIHHPRSANEATTAIAVLEGCDRPLVLEALAAALESPHSSVRHLAVQSLHRRGTITLADALHRRVRLDPSWLVRRAALGALADHPGPVRERIFEAATDPHWRVRHALLRALLRWGEGEVARSDIEERLEALGHDVRVLGVREYLRFRWHGSPGPAAAALAAEGPASRCSFWDWDAAVLARKLDRMGQAGRRAALDAMPFLLGHGDERVRARAAASLREWGETRHLVEALALLDEPRSEAGEAVERLFASLDGDRTEEVARSLLHRTDATPAQRAWALDRAGDVFPCEEEEATLVRLMAGAAAQPVVVRTALARLASRWRHAEVETWLRTLALDREPVAASGVASRVRLAEALRARTDEQAAALLAPLQSDPHPHVRAAALTPARAAELVNDPTRETSWHVLAAAARWARVPLWDLEPEQPWQPAEPAPVVAPPLRPAFAAPPHARLLGPGPLAVSLVGVSGHYGLPVDGLVRAVESGVNLMFWEPNYRTMTEFFGRLAKADRDSLHVIAGTFEADGARVRRDAEGALRALKVGRLALFLLFWVRSWDRVSPDVREALEQLKAEGKVAAFGLSTHSWPLAVEAMVAGWGPVMVRHSAAHRGAEERVFARAAELGVRVITFNNTCYGRLLEPFAGMAPPRASDCYRYTLEQPAVCCCLTAPATREQLEENLSALRDPALPDDRRQALLAFGAALYREERTFRKLVRELWGTPCVPERDRLRPRELLTSPAKDASAAPMLLRLLRAGSKDLPRRSAAAIATSTRTETMFREAGDRTPARASYLPPVGSTTAG
jgi:aryl-alcohol dehydrogenase-like predicted oxidoreductase/HEAT repeat protein